MPPAHTGKKRSSSITPKAKRTAVPLREALPALLEERALSLRALAREVEVSQSHLSRILLDGSGRVVSGELAGRIAVALSLPEDYFPEFRAAVVHDAIDRDPILRESIYRRLRESR
jgi:transcriptional regulator with XRE-family HTH domain